MSKPRSEPPPLLTVADLSHRLQMSASLVYQLVEAGKLPVHRIGNGRGTSRFRPKDVEQYIDSCRTELIGPPARARRSRLKHIHF